MVIPSINGSQVWFTTFNHYPLVNVYVTNWKITMLLMGKSTISTFSIAMCMFTRGYCNWQLARLELLTALLTLALASMLPVPGFQWGKQMLPSPSYCFPGGTRSYDPRAWHNQHFGHIIFRFKLNEPPCLLFPIPILMLKSTHWPSYFWFQLPIKRHISRSTPP